MVRGDVSNSVKFKSRGNLCTRDTKTPNSLGLLIFRRTLVDLQYQHDGLRASNPSFDAQEGNIQSCVDAPAQIQQFLALRPQLCGRTLHGLTPLRIDTIETYVKAIEHPETIFGVKMEAGLPVNAALRARRASVSNTEKQPSSQPLSSGRSGFNRHRSDISDETRTSQFDSYIETATDNNGSKYAAL